MKKYLRWTGIAVASPFILFILLCILIYIPPIQNFLVNTATRYASEATGMQISIGRISLSFPLDLVVNNTVIIDKQDTILNAKKLTAKIQLTPLLRKKIELDGLELSKASVNTANLIEGMTLKGNLGELFVSSHGVELDPETAIVNTLSLKDTHLSICMADTTASDTTSSQPVFWKIQLKNVDFENVSFAMQMALDTFSMSTSLEKLSLRNGLVDLHKSAYSAGSLKLTNGSAYLDTNTLPAAEGFDASHIGITNIKLDVDSAYYAGNDIYANIRDFNLKERSGLEIVSTKGKLVSDAKTLKVPSLQITTPDSYLEFSASMDWEATDAEKDGMINARLMADIGKNDLLKVITGMPEDFIKKYPSAPLQIRAGIDGNLKEIRLTTLSASIQDAFRAQATGSITLPMDSLQRNGNINLSVETGNLNFVESMLSGVVLPYGMKLEGEASVNGSLLGANMQFFPGKKANVILKADYDLQKEGYLVDLNIDSLNIHEFMPHDSIFGLSTSLHAEGNGFDFFSPKTSALLKGEVSHFRYGSLLFSGVTLDAGLKHSQASMMLNVNNRAIDVSANLQALLQPNMIKADLNTHVRLLDWQALSLMSTPFSSSMNIEVHAQTDMKQRHKARATVSGIQLVTAERNFRTKDLHAGFDMATDSVRGYVNAGDLTFLFKSANSLDKFMSKSDLVAKEFGEQWKKKHINQRLIREMLPSAQLKVFSGSDNPVANFLASLHVNYNRLRASFSTSPEDGLNGSIDLYGLRTDSLQLDTIYFKTLQDSVQVKFYSGVKALANKRQEAFDISLNGYIGSTDAQLAIGYLNGKRETGVDLGLKAQLRPNGISMHITPDNPTLVYRPFKVNHGNYIYLSDEGRIHADVKIYDENHSGLSLYSTPDSLVQQDLTVALNQIDIAEFRRIIPYMPDIAGFINAEAHYIQSESSMQVATDIEINNLAYNKQQLGNWEMSAVYLPKETGEHSIDGFLMLNDEEIMSLNGTYLSATGKNDKDNLTADVNLHHLPLKVANAFIPDDMARLKGDLDGSISIEGSTSQPVLNGELGLDSVIINIPQASLNLQLDNRPLKIENSRLKFERFNIFTKGKTPFSIDGYVDMTDMAAMDINLKMEAHNFELINAKQTKESLVHGKIYVDVNAMLKGRPDALTMRGNMNILGSSDFTYVLKDSPLTVEDRLNETVTFVDFSDTTHIAKPHIPAMSLGGMDILMTLHIDEAVQARVNLNESGSNYMLLEGGGDLSFQYQPDGNMLLNGRYSLISGEMKYEMPIIPLKTFYIQDGSYIEWTGNVMNPNLNIKASERVRASVSSDGESTRMVNFNVGVNLTNRLEDLGFTFTLEAPDDGAMQNELAAKSAEEKNKLAVTMLVTGIYMSESNTGGKGFDTNSMLNSFLQSEINKIAGNALKTIDINFGMETTDEGATGNTRTDYNFQFAKRFWNNRFQVIIGGKISTGNDVQQQDESFIDNISLEYRLDNSGTRYIKIFHDKNYESILDGEVIETGAGIVLRKKVSKLSELFIFRSRKKKQPEQTTEN
ncbi:translocation/assembly module TamB domain-containing protein [Phocaeicola coprocola]|jgi:hypothetical protein|uniref:translocation/assembly module TamB domain-containing protein n=1 Tax=Phocaeicola coprocola TaxID=310298 RepID=UPI0022E79E25|nr:translocation/assembly module TamB domain-containing protein [Phocaeicola coprocola]